MNKEPPEELANRLIREHSLAIDPDDAAVHIRLARVAGADEKAVIDMVRRMGQIKTATDDRQAEQQGILVHHIPDDVLPEDHQ